MTVKVRAVANCVGLQPGQEAEIEVTDAVRGCLRAGLLQQLKPKNG